MGRGIPPCQTDPVQTPPSYPSDLTDANTSPGLSGSVEVSTAPRVVDDLVRSSLPCSADCVATGLAGSGLGQAARRSGLQHLPGSRSALDPRRVSSAKQRRVGHALKRAGEQVDDEHLAAARARRLRMQARFAGAVVNVTKPDAAFPATI
jgi:hypothetical protein